jgi:tetratricopeptide (TPR) repeat protein
VNRITKYVRSSWNLGWLFGLFLVVTTLVAYLPALSGKFVWDDDFWTTKIAGLLRDVSGLGVMWCQFTALQQYYPLTGTTFWLDYHFWGFWPLPYHIENVLLHALAALLFWRLLRRLQMPGAWLAAAIFALHPVMVESVAWITERKNVLSLVFYLGALLAYERYASWVTSDRRQVTGTEPTAPVADWSRGTRHRSLFYGLAFLLFLCALLAKATAFSLPAVILLVCWWQRGRIRWRADALPVLPFFALAIGLCLVTAWLEKNHVGAKGAEWAISFPDRCLIAGRAPWFYVGKLLWPANLCFIYPRWRPDVASLTQWIYPITALGAVVALWLARSRLGRGPVAAACFFAGTLFPVLGFMNAYGMRYSFVWDHWVYLPSLGLIALVAALIARAAERLRRPVVLQGFAALVLPVLAVLTWRECGTYADLETLWRTTIAKNPNAFLAYNNLGFILSGKGQVDEAIPYFQKTLEINPGFFEAHNNLGNELLRKGQVDEAMDHFKKAVEIAPTSTVSYYNLGNALLQIGQLDEAIGHFKRALEIEPNFVKAQNNLGVALMRSGRLAEALEHYQIALAISPNFAEAHYNLGCIFDQQGRLDAAIAHYQKAVEIKPDYVEAHYSLGVALGLQGRLNEAVAQYRQAIQLNPDYADAHGNLANVLAAQDRLEEAIPEYRRTLELVPDSAQAHFRFGQALQAQRDFKAAITEYQRTMELNTKHLPAHLSLAWVLATCPEASARNGAKAVELTQQAERLAGSESPQILDTLAAAYAEAGRFGEAVETAQRALNLTATQNNPPLAEAIQNRLKLYEANAPYHEKP